MPQTRIAVAARSRNVGCSRRLGIMGALRQRFCIFHINKRLSTALACEKSRLEIMESVAAHYDVAKTAKTVTDSNPPHGDFVSEHMVLDEVRRADSFERIFHGDR